MNETQFQISMDRLYEYFDRKTPKNAALMQWHKKCEYIPGPAMDWIVGFICDNMDNPPKNMGKAIAAGYFRFQESNPQKIIKHSETKCLDCKSKGLLWYSYIPEGWSHPKQCHVICAKCENWKLHYTALTDDQYRSTKDELIEAGYKLEGPTRELPKIDHHESISKLAEGIGKKLPAEKIKWCCSYDPPNHAPDCKNNVRNLEDTLTDSYDDIPF